MEPLLLKGIITKIFSIDKKEDTDYYHDFYLQKIFIQVDGQEYVVDFVKEKVELLKSCKLKDEVEILVRLKGRSWGNDHSEKRIYNILNAIELKIVSSEFDKPISYRGNIYNLFISHFNGYDNRRYRNLILENLNNTTDRVRITFINGPLENLENFFEVNSSYDKVAIKELVDMEVIQILKEVSRNAEIIHICRLNPNIRFKYLI
ncbi:MAG: hypothetical protein V4581_09335 [Bacteroidota bacterium]